MRPGQLAHVREALGNDVVGRHLDALVQPTVEFDRQLNRNGRARRERLERNGQPMAAHHRRMEAVCDIAQLVQRQRDLSSRLVDPRLRLRVVASRSSSLRRSSDSAISRCCAPSWRIRSSHWRSFSPASMTRSREADGVRRRPCSPIGDPTATWRSPRPPSAGRNGSPAAATRRSARRICRQDDPVEQGRAEPGLGDVVAGEPQRDR
jgi:hypothetical protein